MKKRQFKGWIKFTLGLEKKKQKWILILNSNIDELIWTENQENEKKQKRDWLRETTTYFKNDSK